MPAIDEDGHVATLTYQHADNPSDYCRPIYASDQFDIGRSDVHLACGVEERAISNHHLRVHAVVFEDGDGEEVPPLVYARVLSSNAVTLKHPASNKPGSESILTRDCGDVLLNHGDVLKLTKTTSLLFETEAQTARSATGLDSVRQAEVKRFATQYNVTGRLLGTGGNASVFVAVKQSTGKQYACKIVSMPLKTARAEGLRGSAAEEAHQSLLKKRESLTREYTVLKDIDHPNIISLEKVFCATYHIYIFQELVTGGDLLSYMDQKEVLNEPETANIIWQILKAVEFLHSKQIVHRDIKPENVMMTSWRPGARVVLTDFGQSRTIEDAKSAAKSSAIFRMQSIVGTHGYTAPEVYQLVKRNVLRDEGYSKAIDIWSVGSIAAALLSGEFLFSGEEFENAAADPGMAFEGWDLGLTENKPSWQNIGRKAKSFIRGCLEMSESQRLTAKQALLHDWFTNKHYAADLSAAYWRATQDWKPRNQSGNLVELVDTARAMTDDSQTDNVKHFAEETRSRHFYPAASTKPLPNAFNVQQVHLPPPKQRHTPLPAITEESSLDSLSSPPDYDVQDDLSASPTFVPSTPPRLDRQGEGSFEQLSINDFAPPQTQLTLNNSMPPMPAQAWEDSVAQWQSLLDTLSAPKDGPSRTTAPTAASPRKRTSSFAHIDTVCTEPTQYTGDLDVVASMPQRQRKKVHR